MPTAVQLARAAIIGVCAFILAVPGVSAQKAYFQFVHAAPDVEIPAVDVYVNGVLVVDDLAYQEATPFIEVPARTPVTIAITSANGVPSDPLDTIETTGGFADNTRKWAVLSGVLRPARHPRNPEGIDTSVRISTSFARLSPAEAGDFRLNFFQAMPDCPTFDWHTRFGPGASDVFTVWHGLSFGSWGNGVEGTPRGYPGWATAPGDGPGGTHTFEQLGNFSSYGGEVFLSIYTGWLGQSERPATGILVFADGSVVTKPLSMVTSSESDEHPSAVRLLGNYPNPFNPSTVIEYELDAATDVTLHVTDALGRSVAVFSEGLKPAGSHEVSWSAPADLPSGIYLYTLHAGGQRISRPMLLTK